MVARLVGSSLPDWGALMPGLFDCPPQVSLFRMGHHLQALRASFPRLDLRPLPMSERPPPAPPAATWDTLPAALRTKLIAVGLMPSVPATTLRNILRAGGFGTRSVYDEARDHVLELRRRRRVTPQCSCSRPWGHRGYCASAGRPIPRGE